MKPASFIGGVVAALALLGAVGLAGLAYYTQRQDDRTLLMMSQEDVVFTGAQLELEFRRFEASLGRLISAAPDEAEAAVADATRKFDLLWSRATVTRRGEVGARLSAYASAYPGVAGLPALLESMEPDVFALTGPDRVAAAKTMLDAMAPISADIRKFGLAVARGESVRSFQAREAIRANNAASALMSVSALVIVGLLCVASLLHARRHRANAVIHAELARQAEAAHAARSRFLAMMSHELRTPMNGVMGLIALARRSDCGDSSALLDRAQQSSERLMQMLADIFDLAADEPPEPLTEAPFTLRSFADSLESRVTGHATRSGVEIQIDVDPTAPASLLGSASMALETASRFADYLLETAGVEKIAISLGHADAHLRIAFAITYDSRTPIPWSPALLTGEARDDVAFAVDALGPFVARRRLAAYGGSISATVGDDGRASLELRAPVAAARASAPLVRLALRSASMRMIMVAALKRCGVEAACLDESAPPCSDGCDALLVEPGYASPDAEEEAVARLRAAARPLRLVATGAPRRPELYDAILDMPDDAPRLSAMLLADFGVSSQARLSEAS